jgi:hypothetical protein
MLDFLSGVEKKVSAEPGVTPVAIPAAAIIS